jgi:NADH-quinone oxidoreductase subunit M
MVMSVFAAVAAEGGHGASGAGFPLLTALILLPAFGALAVALTPKSRSEVARLVGVASSAATGALSVWLLTQFETHDAGFQFTSNHSWIDDLGISWHLGVDGISLFLVVLTGLLFPLALWGVKPHHDPKPYTAWMLVLQAGCMGVFPRSTSSSSSSCSRSCWSRCTSSSGAGATAIGSTPR